MRNQLGIAAGLGLTMLSMAALAQGPLYDKVYVDLPYSVTLNGKTLDAGSYEIRELPSAAKTHILQFYKNGGQIFETSAMTIPTLDNNTPEDTKVILHKLGDNQYYFDKVWIQGKNYGYEFPLPDDVKSRQKEMQSSTVAGRWEAGPKSTVAESGRTTTASADTNSNLTQPSSADQNINSATTASRTPAAATADSTTTARSTASAATTESTTARRSTSDSADDAAAQTTTAARTPQTTASERTPQATTGPNTADSTMPSLSAQARRNGDMPQGTPGSQMNRNTPAGTTADQTAPSTGTPGSTMSRRTAAGTTAGTTGTLPGTSANWILMLLCGSGLTSLGFAARRKS